MTSSRKKLPFSQFSFPKSNILTKRVVQSFILFGTITACYYLSFPLIGQIYFSKGEYYLENRYPLIALSYYKRAQYYDESNPKINQRIGFVYLNLAKRNSTLSVDMKMVNLGIKALEKAALFTNHPLLDRDLGLAYKLAGQKEKSKYYYNKSSIKSDGKLKPY